ncbi:Type I restriction enzyme, S subunit [mine drainage metagenome]|uniref:Type I restriction enzyme, S subunit n=1 Tax=mine drainage metagenome TaxID=410659 RepID=A0A3P3ZS98_9ZZZZ
MRGLVMSSEWVEVTFDELKASTRQSFAMGPFGSRIKAENFVTKGVPVIKGGNLNGNFLLEDNFDYLTEEKAEELSSSIALPLDLVITHRGTIGQVGIIPESSRYPKYVVSQSQLKLSFDQSKVSPYFIYYFLRSPEGQRRLLTNASQVGVPAIAQALTSTRAISLSLPHLSEQRAIVNVLLTLDNRIEHNHALAANLEAIARRLFKSWFVDFDPVRAKAAGEKPPGLADDIAALFPDRFVESELGEVPEGWRLETLASVARLNPEAWTTRKHPDEIHYLDLSNVKDGIIEAPTRFSWEEAPSRARRVLEQGDTIIGTVRPGNRSFALIDQTWLTGSTGFAVLRPASNAEREYLYLASTSDDAIERLAHLADGAAYPAVRPEVVLATEAIITGKKIMTAFSSVIKGMIDRASVCKQEANVLAAIRDLLLPRLISGKLRVEDAESIIEEVIA